MTTFISSMAEGILAFSEPWEALAGDFSTGVLSLITLGVTLQIMWHGINMIRGDSGGVVFLDVFAKLFRALCVVGLLLGASYGGTVVQGVKDARESLSAKFNASAGGTTEYEQLDQTIENILSSWDDANKSAKDSGGMMGISITSVIIIFAWCVMAAAFCVVVAVAAVNLIMLDVSLAFLFAVGPIFLAGYAFTQTAHFGNSWMTAVLKYVMTAVVIMALVGLAANVLNGTAEAAKTAWGEESLQAIKVAVMAILQMIVLLFAMNRLPATAAAVAGGIGLSVMGAAAVNRMAGAPGAAAAGSARYVAGRGASALGFGAGQAAGAGASAGGASSLPAATGATAAAIQGAGARSSLSQAAASRPLPRASR